MVVVHVLAWASVAITGCVVGRCSLSMHGQVWLFMPQHVRSTWWGTPHCQLAGCGVDLGVCVADGSGRVWAVVAFIVVGSGVVGVWLWWCVHCGWSFVGGCQVCHRWLWHVGGWSFWVLVMVVGGHWRSLLLVCGHCGHWSPFVFVGTCCLSVWSLWAVVVGHRVCWWWW